MMLRNSITILLLALSIASPVLSADGFNLDQLRRLPTLDNGRVKPLDTYARETIRFLTGSESFGSWDPVALLVDVAFQPKRWSDTPMLTVDYLPLKERLGVGAHVKYLAASDLVSNQKFHGLIDEIRQSGTDTDKLPKLEKEAVMLYHRLSLLENQIDAGGWKLVPHESDPNGAWKGLGASQDKAVKEALSAMRDAYVKPDVSAFDKAVGELTARLPAVSKLPYPDSVNLDREVWYHHVQPFKKAAIFYLLGFLAFLLTVTVAPRAMYKPAMALALVGFALHAYGIGLRSVISGRAPVSNVYETMLWVPFGINMFAFIFELVYRGRFFGMVASIMSAAILLMSEAVPLDPYISPLVPVLRSNYWLIIHVLTITLGYAAATLSMGLGHLWLLIFMAQRSTTGMNLKNIEKFLYHAIHVTVLFIGVGTILGGVWANASWGRYWAWDPKETWALISLLGFLAILHARIVNAVGGFGTAVGTILAWQLVLFCWYGVNYFLVGLHSYAGGDTAAYLPWQVLAWAGFEAAFLIVATVLYRRFLASSGAKVAE